MEFEDRDFKGEEPIEPPIDETSFTRGATGGIDPAVQTSINLHNDPINNANSILSAADLADIDTIVRNKNANLTNDQKKLFAAIITLERPVGESGLNKVINMFNEFSKSGDYEKFVRENFHTKEQIEEYLKNAKPTDISISDAPSPPTVTPGVALDVRNKIDFRLADLGITTVIDHTKFIPLENGGLVVKTNKGSIRITQQDNPKLYLVRPGIPTGEYEGLFGFDKQEYKRRVGLHNARVVEPVDVEVDEDQDWLDDVSTPLLGKDVSDTGKSGASRESIGKIISNTVKGFIDRLKTNRIKSEFGYRQLATEGDDLEMEEFSREHPDRLPERELEAIDQRFQTIEGQIAIATSKAGDITTQILELEQKSDRTEEEETQLSNLKDELQGQVDIVKDLKGQYAENTEKMRKQRNIALGIVGAAGAGGILAGIFEAVANALGSDTAKKLIPKSTDPKDIADSGIGKMIKKKLDDLAKWFKDKYLNSSGTTKAFWHMMENTVGFLKDHLWIILAAALAIVAYEYNKR